MPVETTAPARPLDAGARGRAVVVERHPLLRSTITELLGGLDYVVHAASHSFLGLRLARRVRPDLVVLGLAPADRAGTHVLAELRAHPATARTPVLILAGYPSELTGGRPWERLLAPPFTYGDIAREIKDLVDRRAALPA